MFYISTEDPVSKKEATARYGSAHLQFKRSGGSAGGSGVKGHFWFTDNFRHTWAI